VKWETPEVLSYAEEELMAEASRPTPVFLDDDPS